MDQLLAINQVGKLKKSVATEKLVTFRDELLNVITSSVKAPGLDAHTELRRDMLKKANKEQLCLWVETLVLAFSATALPMLQDTCQAAECVEEMKGAKIKDQATIIDLQQKLIDAKDKQVKKLQDTVQSGVNSVQSEIKTFSSVLQNEIKAQSTEVQKNVASAISVRKVGNAVRQVVDKEERSKNIVIYGVPEDLSQPLESRVGDIMQHLDQKPRIVDCCRLGKEQEGAVRPIKVTLSSSSIVVEVLRNSTKLKNAEGCRQIFICPDRTVEQRKAQKGLVVQLKKLRTEHPGARYCIRNNKVIPCEIPKP